MLRIALLFLICSLYAHAQQHAPLLADYTHTAWGPQQGAPAQIQAIAETTDGWLWLSTPTGLYRFDGERFEHVDAVGGQPLAATLGYPLNGPSDGGLWLGYRYGGVSFFKDGQAHHYRVADGVPPDGAMSFTRAPDGQMWMTSKRGLAYLEGDHWHQVGAETGFDPVPNFVRQVLFDFRGTQWVSTEAGIYYRPKGVARFAKAYPRTVELWSMAEGPDGTIWASDGKDANYRVTLTPPPPNKPPLPDYPGSGMWFDRDGTMWVLRQNSVERAFPGHYPDAAQRITPETGLSGTDPATFLADRHGNVWIGTANGLDRFRPNRLRALPVSTPLGHPSLVADAQGEVWVSDWVAGTYRYRADGQVSRQLGEFFVGTYRPTNGPVAFGTASGITWQENGESRHLPIPASLHGEGARVDSLCADARGDYWASLAGKGLYRIRDGEWTKAGSLFRGLPNDIPVLVSADQAGKVWVGYHNNQIALIDGASARVYGQAQGLQIGVVMSVYGVRRHVWIGGEQGVAYFNGQQFLPLMDSDGRAFRNVTGIVERANGELWLHGSDGISHIAATQIQQFLQDHHTAVAYERFDAEDGLIGTISPHGPYPSMVEASDGRLWVATGSNVVTLDPDHLRHNAEPPSVFVRSVIANGREYPPQTDIVLPKGTRSLQIAFSATNLSMPERVRFRYQFNGVDRDWQDSDKRRDVFYTNLGPGKYQFRLIAANEDGVWNNTGTQVNVTISPTFVQTNWFKLICLLLGLTLIYLAYDIRARQLTRAVEARLRERIEERERIARALHDTLLQGMQGVILLMDVAIKRVPAELSARTALERALGRAQDVLAEGRDQVTALRISAGDGLSLINAINEAGSLLAETHTARFSMVVTGDPTALNPIVCEEIFAIAREALANAFRHADATRIDVELIYSCDDFRACIRDNGVGIEECVQRAGQRPGHWGLVGMHERARKIGATIEIWSRPGAGTEIALKVSGALAYRQRRYPGWLYRLMGLFRKVV